MCSFAEHHVKTEPELRACAKADQDKVTGAQITLDGVQIKPVRLQSPMFTVTLPENNALGLKPQTSPALSDGGLGNFETLASRKSHSPCQWIVGRFHNYRYCEFCVRCNIPPYSKVEYTRCFWEFFGNTLKKMIELWTITKFQ